MIKESCRRILGLPRWLSGKEPTCNEGDMLSTPGSGRSPAEGNGNPLQYSCLGDLMDRSLVGYSPWGHKELHTTQGLNHHHNRILTLWYNLNKIQNYEKLKFVDAVKKRRRMKGRKFRVVTTLGKGRKGIRSGRDTLGSSTELEMIIF